ncbi:MAG: ammonium transporter [Saprospiraceae bacterium]
MKTRWMLIFSILTLIALAGGFIPVENTAPEGAAPINPADTAWMLMAAGLVLLMTPGLSFFYGGMVNFKSVVSTMLQSFISLGVVSFLWVLVGFSLAFGDSIGGIIGNPATFFMFRNVGLSTHPDLAPTIPLLLFALFQLKFAIITPALITGSFAERVRFTGYLLFIVLFSLLIYTPLAHWTWHPQGFLRQWGVLDFAGGTVVHMSAGFAAIAAVTMLGGRKKSANHSSPANIPYVILGTGLLWFGWFGFNAGSALGANEAATLAFATTNMASASAMMTWVFFDAVRGKKITAMGACIGAVVGLVAITPAAGFVTVGQSFFIGFIAAIASNLAVSFFGKKSIDDTLDVFPCHGVGGIVGMLCTGIFASGVGLIYGKTETFLYHLLALAIVGIFSFCGSFLLLKLTNLIIPMRVTEEQEQEGLDISQHGESMTSLRERVDEILKGAAWKKNGVPKEPVPID